MITGGEHRAEAARLRDLARDVTDPALLIALRDMINELEARARELEKEG